MKPGLFGAVKGAIRPVDLRGDFRLLVPLVTRTKAVWVPTVLIVASSIAAFVPALVGSLGFVLGLFIIQPPMAAPFLAGILAPRAGWLAGLLIGLISGVASTIVIFGLSSLPGGVALTSTERLSYVSTFLTVWPLFGAFVAAFAAFYKRFLQLSNPNAGRQAPRRGQAGKPTSRPASKRR